MKKTLLLSAAVICSLTSMGQLTGYGLHFDSAVDTVMTYKTGDVNRGYYFGTNSTDDRAFAERYDVNGWNDSITVYGIIGVWKGNGTSIGGKSMDGRVWTSSKKVAYPLHAGWKYKIPDIMKGTVQFFFSEMKLSGVDTCFRFFSSPVGIPLAHATKDNDDHSFFIGFDLLSPNYASHGADSIGLASTKTSTYPDYKYDTLTKVPLLLDTVVNNVNVVYAYNSSPSGYQWENLRVRKGTKVNLLISPIFGKIPTGIASVTKNDLTIFGNYPNPATNNTNIKFSLTTAANVTIRIMDVTGRTITTMPLNNQAVGEHIVPIDLSGYTAGTYVYVISTEEASMGAMMSIVK